MSDDDEYERRYMDPGERTLFREKVVSKTAFRLSIGFALVFGLVGLVLAVAGLIGASAGLAPGLIFGVPCVLFGALMGVLGVLFSVFRVMVTGSHLHVHFGWAKRKIPLDAIQSVNAITLKGFRQGKVQIGLDGVVRTWVGQSNSGRGVEITYQEKGSRKNVMTMGSENADQLASTLNRARNPAQTRVAEGADADADADAGAGADADAGAGAGAAAEEEAIAASETAASEIDQDEARARR